MGGNDFVHNDPSWLSASFRMYVPLFPPFSSEKHIQTLNLEVVACCVTPAEGFLNTSQTAEGFKRVTRLVLVLVSKL